MTFVPSRIQDYDMQSLCQPYFFTQKFPEHSFMSIYMILRHSFFKVCKKFDSLVVSYFLKKFYCYSITVVCILFFYKYFPVYKIWGGWYFLILQNKQCSVKVGHVRLSVYVEYFHEKVSKSSVVSFQNLIRHGRVFLQKSIQIYAPRRV